MSRSASNLSKVASPAIDAAPTLQRAKRQAKRLLAVSKEGPLKITKLAEAQAVTARLFGYPTWHALESGHAAPLLSPDPRPHPADWLAHPRAAFAETPEHDFAAMFVGKCLERGQGFNLFSSDFLPSSVNATSTPSSAIVVQSFQNYMKQFNPMVLPFGMVRPAADLKHMLVYWLESLLNPDHQAIPSLTDFLTDAVDRLYQDFMPGGRLARAYEANSVHNITNTLNGQPMTWWEVMDIQACRGQRELAIRAQVMASPTLSDLVSIFNLQDISDEMHAYSQVRLPDGEALNMWAARRLARVLFLSPELTAKNTLDSAAPLWSVSVSEKCWIRIGSHPQEAPGMSVEGRWLLVLWLSMLRGYTCLSPALPRADVGDGSELYMGPFGAAKVASSEHFYPSGFDYAAEHRPENVKNSPPIPWFDGIDSFPPGLSLLWGGFLLLARTCRKENGAAVFSFRKGMPLGINHQPARHLIELLGGDLGVVSDPGVVASS